MRAYPHVRFQTPPAPPPPPSLQVSTPLPCSQIPPVSSQTHPCPPHPRANWTFHRALPSAHCKSNPDRGTVGTVGLCVCVAAASGASARERALGCKPACTAAWARRPVGMSLEPWEAPWAMERPRSAVGTGFHTCTQPSRWSGCCTSTETKRSVGTDPQIVNAAMPGRPIAPASYGSSQIGLSMR